MTYTTKFIDGEWMITKITFEYDRYFSLSGECNWSCWQITFVALWDDQTRLQELWTLYHLKSDVDQSIIDETIELLARLDTKDGDVTLITDDLDYDDAIIALARHLSLPLDEVDEVKKRCSDWYYEYRWQEYIVGTDDECCDLWVESIENAMDDYLPETLVKYWHNSVTIENGVITASLSVTIEDRAGELNRYDGSEETEEVNGEIYYIYRQN